MAIETSALQEPETQRRGVLASLELPPRKVLVALVAGAMAAASGLFFAADDLKLPGVALAFALAWAAVIDIDRFMLPDAITLPVIGFGLLFAALQSDDLLSYVVGTAVGYFALASLAILYRSVRKRDALGMGDAKLFAGAGAWLGVDALPHAMLTSAALAFGWILLLAIVRREFRSEDVIAFGPFLTIGFWVMWLSEVFPS